MSTSPHVVITLHCAGGFRSQIFMRMAEALPLESMCAGFSVLIIVIPLSALSMAREFISCAEALRASDSSLTHLQIGIAHGVLPDPVPFPMSEEHPVVVDAFKSGLSPLRFSEEIERIERVVASSGR